MVLCKYCDGTSRFIWKTDQFSPDSTSWALLSRKEQGATGGQVTPLECLECMTVGPTDNFAKGVVTVKQLIAGLSQSR
ncbi:MAG: hypothetical protein QGI09_08150, partial [Dehalococcoidia bacterium]|nr:hypothetical protein [Dehalococcoidia bacterium]